MSRSLTQFAIAVILSFSVAVVAVIATTAWVFGDAPGRAEPILFLVIGSLTTGMGTAVAYLFRLNGKGQS